MKYLNKTKKDVQVNLPKTIPVEWVMVKKGESKDLPVSEDYAKRFGLYTDEALDEMKKEKEVKVEAEESSIGSAKVETKVKKKRSKKKSKK